MRKTQQQLKFSHHRKWMTYNRQAKQKSAYRSHLQHVILCAFSQTWSEQGLRECFHVVQLGPLHKLAVNSPHCSRPTTRRGPGQAPVQRPGLSDLWHNANLCLPWREPPCAVDYSSERALFSVTEMITEMGGREGICYITSREGNDL